MTRVLREDELTTHAAWIKVSDVQPYDVLISGAVVLSTHLPSNSEYAMLKVRKNDREGNGDVSERWYLRESEIRVIV